MVVGVRRHWRQLKGPRLPMPAKLDWTALVDGRCFSKPTNQTQQTSCLINLVIPKTRTHLYLYMVNRKQAILGWPRWPREEEEVGFTFTFTFTFTFNSWQEI